jgi:flagellar hook-basal body complex protein FliE
VTIIPPVSPITPGPRPLDASRAVGGGEAAGGGDGGFANAVTKALDSLDQSQKATDSLARAAATGDLQRIEDLMVAANETQLATQLTVAVRNRAVEAFNDIMRMQV